MRHFIDLLDLTRQDLMHLFEEAARLKAAHNRREATPCLLGRVIGLVFEKPSLRTRVSFQAAIAQLGGSSLFLSGKEVGLGSRESIPDMARALSQYVDGVVLRTFSHQVVEEFAAHAACSVINGLSDYYHPCQALADLFTVQEVLGSVAGRTIAFIGDGNNVARSLAICCGKLGVRFVMAAPAEHCLDSAFLEVLRRHVPEAELEQTANPQAAACGADVIYTDVWTSMGQEAERDERLRRFADFQVNDVLLAQAPPHARVMHCLPAHRGEEITSAVLDGPQSVVFQQAGNRMHAQKALLQWLLA
jgi:ornithine carbamoyltransferase